MVHIAEDKLSYMILLLNQRPEVQATLPVQKRAGSKPLITIKRGQSAGMGASGTCKSTRRNQKASCDCSLPDHQPVVAGQPADSRRIRPGRQGGKPCVITVAPLKHLFFGMSA